MISTSDSARVDTITRPLPAQLRVRAARAASVVIDGGRSSDHALSGVLDATPLSDRDRALVKEMTLGVVRWYWMLDDILQQLIKTRIRNKDRDISLLLMIGVYQLKFMRIPDHAAVDATVQACELAGKPWAKGLVNGVLRNYARNSVALDQRLTGNAALFAHPDWIRARVEKAWPRAWKQILDANNEHPPMCLRVNTGRIERTDFLEQLHKAGIGAVIDPHVATGLILEKPVAVESLPGFTKGWVSIQDTAAQLVAPALDLRPGYRVLDACAAPGNKTAHLLESQPALAEVIAVDIDGERVERLRRTLDRLQLSAQCIRADVTKVESWWDGKPFDRVLVDAPCSGSGVIRRHPDIKHNRRPEDIDALCKIQASLLESLWPLVAHGGRLMYVTCSIFPEENENQIRAFLERHAEVVVESLTMRTGIDCSVGRQTLPGVHDMDGFFFSMLKRRND